MKKLFLLIVLINTILSSCKNDAIDVDIEKTPEPKVSLILNVSTTSGYEPFDIESYKSGWLTEKEPYYIGVKSYLYDASGNIVDSVNSHIKTFNQVSQSFNGLTKGNYTVVTVETLVNSDYGYSSDYWYIDGANQISTLSLKLDTLKVPDECVYWSGVVAIASKSINISSDMTESMAPSPVGSMVNTYYLDFDKSKNALVAFYTKNKPIGMFLNPSIPNSEKCIYDKNLDSNTFDFRDYVYSDTGFTKEVYAHSVYILEQGNVQWCFGSSTSEQLGNDEFTDYPRQSSYVTFESGKYYYAGFCYVGGTDNNNCAAIMATSFNEITNWYSKLDKSKQSSDGLYKEPYLSWGGTVTDVKSYMSGYTLESDIQLNSYGEYYMVYSGQDNKKNIMFYEYDFEQQNTGLSSVYISLDGSKVKEDEIKTHLQNNGYEYQRYDEDNSLYIYSSSKTMVGFYKTSSGNYVVLYIERSSNSRTRGADIISYCVFQKNAMNHLFKNGNESRDILFRSVPLSIDKICSEKSQVQKNK